VGERSLHTREVAGSKPAAPMQYSDSMSELSASSWAHSWVKRPLAARHVGLARRRTSSQSTAPSVRRSSPVRERSGVFLRGSQSTARAKPAIRQQRDAANQRLCRHPRRPLPWFPRRGGMRSRRCRVTARRIPGPALRGPRDLVRRRHRRLAFNHDWHSPRAAEHRTDGRSGLHRRARRGSAHALFRYDERGRLTDLWHAWNTLLLARQLGAPAPDLRIGATT
jgi:hypothetical protein